MLSPPSKDTNPYNQKDILLDQEDLSLAAGSTTRAVLRDEFLKRVESKSGKYNPVTSLFVHESILKRMISKFSEQVIYQPLNEIRFWFENYHHRQNLALVYLSVLS
jgi:hypothetical protein